MSKNYNKKDYQDSFNNENNQEIAESVDSVKGETVEAPVKEKVNKPIKEKSPAFSQSISPKKKGKVVLITRDGCIVQTLEGSNVRIFGNQYLQEKIGNTIEF